MSDDERAAVQLHLGVKDFTKPNGVKSGDLLRWQHFGTETIPPRPVLRYAAEKTIPKNKARFKAYFMNLVRNPRDAKKLETVLLQTLGAQAVAEAKDEINTSEGLTPNAPRTVAKKGFDKPLFETGELQRNLAYEVVE